MTHKPERVASKALPALAVPRNSLPKFSRRCRRRFRRRRLYNGSKMA